VCVPLIGGSAGSSRRKKSKFDTSLEAFAKAITSISTTDNEHQLKLQAAQHEHERAMFGMLMQSITTQVQNSQHHQQHFPTPQTQLPFLHPYMHRGPQYQPPLSPYNPRVPFSQQPPSQDHGMEQSFLQILGQFEPPVAVHNPPPSQRDPKPQEEKEEEENGRTLTSI